MPELPANPWDGLSPSEPLVLASDCLAVEVYNERAQERGHLQHLIHTNLIPEPFFGPFDAPVVVLLLNPSVSEQDAQAHADPALRERLLANLRRDAPEERQQAHVHLTADIAYPGADWWGDAVNRLTREVIDGRQLTRERIAARLLAVQFFPYHSQTFDHGLLRLPSPGFDFALVRRAIASNALIIMRGGNTGSAPCRNWCAIGRSPASTRRSTQRSRRATWAHWRIGICVNVWQGIDGAAWSSERGEAPESTTPLPATPSRTAAD